MKNGVIVETMMISRTERIPAFSIRTGFSVSTGMAIRALDGRSLRRLASKKMRIARSISLLVLTIAFATFGSDCLAMTTPQQAMRCCSSMHCSSHGYHGRDCCKSMSEVHPPFVLPAAQLQHHYGHVVIAVAVEPAASPRLDCPFFVVAAQCHAPPASNG